jgi:hypothetical protein
MSQQATNVISLAEVRAARQAAVTVTTKPATRPTATRPTTLQWQQSKRGNSWVLDERTRIHLVVYETRRGWSGRVTAPEGDSWYLDTMPPGISSVEEAKAWAEDWLDAAARFLDANPHAS